MNRGEPWVVTALGLHDFPNGASTVPARKTLTFGGSSCSFLTPHTPFPTSALAATGHESSRDETSYEITESIRHATLTSAVSAAAIVALPICIALSLKWNPFPDPVHGTATLAEPKTTAYLPLAVLMCFAAFGVTMCVAWVIIDATGLFVTSICPVCKRKNVKRSGTQEQAAKPLLTMEGDDTYPRTFHL